MRTILFINHSRALHGAEMVLLRSMLVAHQAGQRCLLIVPAIVKEEGFVQAAAEIIGRENIYTMRYRAYGYGRVRTRLVGLYNYPAIRKICHLIRREQVDVVYSNTSITGIGIEAAQRCRVPHVWHLHEPVDAMYGWTPANKQLYRRWLCYSRNTCIFISHAQRGQWEQTIGCSLPGEVVYNPVRTDCLNEQGSMPDDGLPATRDEQEMNITSPQVVYGYIGSFEPRKNLSAIVEAFRQLHAQNPDTRLLLYGAKDEQELQRYSGAGIETHLHTRDAAAFYRQIDVLLLPSWSETMPLVIIEAILCGVATIQTTESGMKELLKDELDTYFVMPNDRHRMLCCMQQLLDEDERIKMTTYSYQTISQHQFNEQYARKISNILCQ